MIANNNPHNPISILLQKLQIADCQTRFLSVYGGIRCEDSMQCQEKKSKEGGTLGSWLSLIQCGVCCLSLTEPDFIYKTSLTSSETRGMEPRFLKRKNN